MGLKSQSVTGKIDHYQINIGSILDQHRITSFDRLHIPPKMFVDLLKQVEITLTNYNSTQI